MAETLKNKRVGTNIIELNYCRSRIDKTKPKNIQMKNKTEKYICNIQYEAFVSSKRFVQINKKIKEHSTRKKWVKDLESNSKKRFINGQ